MVKNNPEKFQANFEENKKAVMEIAEIPSKKLRNLVAGYITKLVRNNQK